MGLGFADEHAYDYAKHLRPIDESVGKFIKPTIRMPNVFASEPTVVVQKESQVFDPNVAQVLSALDDEAYIEEDIDGFFDSIGQDTLPDSYVPEPVYNSDDEDWVKEYKKYSASRATSDDDFSDDNDSQRTPRVAKTATTSFSMSSSSIFRNEKLSHLDDCFEKVLHEYSDEEVGELNEDDPEVMGHLSLEMNEMFDQFLSTTLLNNNSTMIIERRAEHLDEIRQILKGDNQRIIDQYKFVDDSPVTGIPMPQVPKRDRWDCETVLTGYTNIYNHPQLIKEISKNAPQIRLKGPKGMPVLNVAKEKPVKKGIQSQPVSRDETPEDKKARKQAIKSEKKVFCDNSGTTSSEKRDKADVQE